LTVDDIADDYFGMMLAISTEN